MDTPVAQFRVDDAVAMPVGGELRLLRVVADVGDRLALVDATDMRRRIVYATPSELAQRAERARA